MRLPRLIRRAEMPLPATDLARWLIGKTLVRETPAGRILGRIVETEAYLPDDAAAHSFRGQTARNRSMFLRRGHAYVYFIYGCWFALNVSADKEGVGAAVLLRALEPLDGILLMQQRCPHLKKWDLAKGPGRLATTLGITRELDSIDLCQKGPLWLGTAIPRTKPVDIGLSPRIGITKEAHRLLRFYEQGNPCLSGPRTLSQKNTPVIPGE